MLEELDRKLAHVLEPRMRLQLVRERLLACDPDQACALLAAAISRGPGPGRGADLLRDAMIELLTLPAEPPALAGALASLPYALRRDIYSAAVRTGADDVARLLRTRQEGDESGEAERRLPREIADIPLGRRRSLARGEDRNLLEKLALDPDRAVIANLLRNPRTREQDVVRIAALRPVPGSTLVEIGRSPRWSRVSGVRLALARNPHCPVDLAIRMMAALPLPDLRAMSRDPDLHPETLSQVRSEIERRGGKAR